MNVKRSQNHSPDVSFIDVNALGRCMILDIKLAKLLYKFIVDQGYISHEFHPEIHNLIPKLRQFIEANE